MGPRSDERGNSLSWITESESVPMLQWGRALTSAEIQRIRTTDVHHEVASMGPRSDERGNEYISDSPRRRERASMGPRSDERGNLPEASSLLAYCRLQWGRALTSAEIRPS